MHVGFGHNRKALVLDYHREGHSESAPIASVLEDVVGVFEFLPGFFVMLTVDDHHSLLEVLHFCQLKRIDQKRDISQLVALESCALLDRFYLSLAFTQSQLINQRRDLRFHMFFELLNHKVLVFALRELIVPVELRDNFDAASN